MSEVACGTSKVKIEKTKTYEVIHIEKTEDVCSYCDSYAKLHQDKPVAIISCEGACLRGEISRRAANLVSFELAAEKTVRICLGGAFTTDTGQRDLVRNADRAIVIEGCFIQCASRMMRGVLADFEPEVVIADDLYELEGAVFGINELEEDNIQSKSQIVAERIYQMISE
jgi:uncharacterized metal-binding protein